MHVFCSSVAWKLKQVNADLVIAQLGNIIKHHSSLPNKTV